MPRPGSDPKFPPATDLAGALNDAIRRAQNGRPADLRRLRELAGAFIVELFPDARSATVVLELECSPTGAMIALPLPGRG